MNLIYDLSPLITLRKYEYLDDNNSPSQPNKVDMNDNDRNESLTTKDVPSSSIHPFGLSTRPYITNFKEFHKSFSFIIKKII